MKDTISSESTENDSKIEPEERSEERKLQEETSCELEIELYIQQPEGYEDGTQRVCICVCKQTLKPNVSKYQRT